ILMLEDDLQLAELVGKYLLIHFRVDVVYNLVEAREYIAQFNYDVILLDRNINGSDIGLELISEIKEKNHSTGIIVISAYDSIGDKIEGLNLGADDYLDKPFDNEELLARIYVQGRRGQALPEVSIEGLVCNTLEKTLEYQSQDIALSNKESNLFFYLLQKKGSIVSKDELLNALYMHPENICSNTLDVTIRNIRKKIPVSIIRTVKTRGFIID
ncbi:MAG: response regulator transcription factor, partial [Sulfurimonas sp.]|nr:response regulator transcription factor [Sulfurimonas sp.]